MDSALKTPAIGLTGPTPLLRLQSDERLVALARRGNQGAFEALVGRYQSRLLSFTRHMLGSKEDAEDVLQEVFAAAYNAMMADERPINVRPWLYRIARNRSLNHLRKQQPIGVDSMDIHFADGGISTADRVHKREDFRHLMEDVGELPETQRTALLLREIDALSYEQIAEAMETTVPSVKSLLVRARVSLAEAAEARRLTCEEVREELGEVAEGIRKMSPPVRRHLRSCDRCSGFRKQLNANNKAMAAILPIAPLLMFKKTILAHLGLTTSAGAAAGTAAMGTAAVTSTGAMSAGFGALATKAAAGLAAAAVVTAGAVEVNQVQQRSAPSAPPAAAIAPPAPEPVVVASRPQPAAPPASDGREGGAVATAAAAKTEQEPAPAEATPAQVTPAPPAPDPAPPAPAVDAETPPLAPAEQGADAVTLPADDVVTTVPGGAGAPPAVEQAPPPPAPVTPPPTVETPPPPAVEVPPPAAEPPAAPAETTATATAPAEPPATP
jgi:RNA polymerase sigma factor (sigma-70 family)